MVRQRIEAELVILAPFTYDNTRLLLLSKTAKFPNGFANSSGHVGKHFMTHIRSRVQIAFDDQYVNVYMGPSAQKHSIDDFNSDNFDHGGLGFIRGAQISFGPVALEGGPIGHHHESASSGRRAGAPLSGLLSKQRARGHRCPDRRFALSASDHRSRSRYARSMGPAGAAFDL
jgi:hypothetical protein